MRLVSLEIENWGPYQGVQGLDLDVTTEAPVITVEGENERGKTSLTSALRYALYGKMADHDDQDVPAADLANWDARDQGEPFWFGVTLVFEHDHKRLELSRRHKAIREVKIEGPGVQILESRKHLRVVGGDPFPEKDIDDQVKRILHPDISSFFLFDGETLTKVQKLLKTPDAASIYVRDSIERALGIPALRLLRSDVDHLTESAGAEVRKALKAEKVDQQAKAALESAQEELTRADKDLEQLVALRKKAQQRFNQAKARLAEVDTIKELLYERQGLKESVEKEEADIEDTRNAIQQLLDEFWWLPAANVLRIEADKAADALAKVATYAEERTLATGELARVRAQLADSLCHTCGQMLPQDAIAPLRKRESELIEKLDTIPVTDSLPVIQQREKVMRSFQTASVVEQQLIEFEGSLKRSRLRIVDAKGKIDRLTEQVQGEDIEIAALDADVLDAQEDLILIDMNFKDAESRRSKAIRDRKAATEAIAASSGPSGKHAQAQMAVYKKLDSYLEEAIRDFSNSMRNKVQDEASEIFRQLTTEPDYAGLRIDGHYYLSIVDSNDRVVARRSAGANQIVTMALIGALAKCSVEEGPIVMDTPFARLDMGHRGRILNWTAALGSQVILFVQSGEFDRTRDLKHLNNRVGRSYVLRRVGTNATKIERYSHG